MIAGRGNIPLFRMKSEFLKIIGLAYTNLTTCSGSDRQGCEDGCYVCMKSYGMHYYAHQVDKRIAVMFTGYLLGKNAFVPSITPYDPTPNQYDLTFQLKICGSELLLMSKDTYTAQIEGSQNQAIFNLLIKAIQAEFREQMTSLLIRAKQDYLVNAINRGEINTNKEDFVRLQFNLLRFKYVRAEKG